MTGILTKNLTEFDIENLPDVTFGKVQTAGIAIPVTPETNIGDIVTIVSTAAAFKAADVGNFIRVGSGDNGSMSYYKITVFNSSTSVDAAVLVKPLITSSFNVSGSDWTLEEPV